MTPRTLARLALPLALCLAAPRAASARQESAVPAPGEPANPAASETPAATTPAQRVERLRADLERWRELAASWSGEDREVALDQVRRTREDLDEELGALASSKEEADRSLAAEVSREQVDALWGEIDAIEERSSALRADPPKDLAAGALDDDLHRLERDAVALLDVLTDHVTRLQALGHREADALRERLVRELETRAELAVARLELRTGKLADLERRLADAPEDGKADLEQRIADLELLSDAAQDTFARTTADLADLGVGVDPELKKARLEVTGELEVEDVDFDVIAGFLQRWGSDVKEAVLEGLPRWIFRAVLFLGVLAAFLVLARLVRRLVRTAVRSSKLRFSSLLREFFENVAANLVLFLGVLIALSQIGIELGPVLAGLGIAGFVLGFALQDTLSNFASGLMILVYRPFDVDDAVSVAGVTGKVSKMSMVSTTILTFDNQQLVVPNTKIWGDVITNITARDTRRVDMTFGIGYQDDIPRAEEILAEVVSAHPKVLDEPAPTIKLSELGDSSVDFVVRPWARTADYWDVKFDLTRTVKLRFDEEGISIPFPQRDVHVHYTGQAEEDPSTLVPGRRRPVDPEPVEDPAPATAAEDDDERG